MDPFLPMELLRLTPPPHNGVGKEEDSLISTQMINVKVGSQWVTVDSVDSSLMFDSMMSKCPKLKHPRN